MLSVGREIDIREQQVLCRSSLWEGIGTQLAIEAIEKRRPEIFPYACECPECGCIDPTRKRDRWKFHSRDVSHIPGASTRDYQLEEDLPLYAKEYTPNGNIRA